MRESLQTTQQKYVTMKTKLMVREKETDRQTDRLRQNKEREKETEEEKQRVIEKERDNENGRQRILFHLSLGDKEVL